MNNNLSYTSAWRAAALFALLLPSAALSQVINCERVLNNNLINTKSTDRSETLIASFQTDLCNSTFQDRAQAQDKLRSGGWDLEVFDYFNNSLKDNKRESTGFYDIRRTDFCTKTSNEIARTFGSNYLEVNGRFVLEAYDKCTETMSRNSLYLDYELIPLGTIQILQGTLRRKVSGNNNTFPYTINGLGVRPKGSEISCDIGSRSFSQDESDRFELKVEESTVIISCEKPSTSPAYITIETSMGDFSIYAPSQNDSEQAEIFDKVSSDLEKATSRIPELEFEIDRLNRELASKNIEASQFKSENSSINSRIACGKARIDEFKKLLDTAWPDWQAMAAYMPGSAEQAALVNFWLTLPELPSPFDKNLNTTKYKIDGKLSEVSESLDGAPNC